MEWWKGTACSSRNSCTVDVCTSNYMFGVRGFVDIFTGNSGMHEIFVVRLESFYAFNAFSHCCSMFLTDDELSDI